MSNNKTGITEARTLEQLTALREEMQQDSSRLRAANNIIGANHLDIYLSKLEALLPSLALPEPQSQSEPEQLPSTGQITGIHYVFNPPAEIRIGDNIVSVITIREVKALCRILEREYINYEDTEAHEVVNKLFRLKKEYESSSNRNDMDRTSNQIEK